MGEGESFHLVSVLRIRITPVDIPVDSITITPSMAIENYGFTRRDYLSLWAV